MRTGVRPRVVAFLRGAAEAAALAIIGVAAAALTDLDGGDLAPWAPIGLLALRQIEGFVDDVIDPSHQRVLGGRPAD